jgi:hypothetical protein
MITSDTLIVISKIQIRLLRLTATHDYRLHCFWSGSMGKPFDHQECRPSISSPRICDDIITVVVVLGSLTITIKMPQRSWNEPIRSTAANSLTNEMLSIRACHASNISRHQTHGGDVFVFNRADAIICCAEESVFLGE